jgi:hypothetical protein
MMIIRHLRIRIQGNSTILSYKWGVVCTFKEIVPKKLKLTTPQKQTHSRWSYILPFWMLNEVAKSHRRTLIPTRTSQFSDVVPYTTTKWAYHRITQGKLTKIHKVRYLNQAFSIILQPNWKLSREIQHSLTGSNFTKFIQKWAINSIKFQSNCNQWNNLEQFQIQKMHETTRKGTQINKANQKPKLKVKWVRRNKKTQ